LRFELVTCVAAIELVNGDTVFLVTQYSVRIAGRGSRRP
jgi:hypothetical protein